jgi:pilus assembly protein Flp/PilA
LPGEIRATGFALKALLSPSRNTNLAALTWRVQMYAHLSQLLISIRNLKSSEGQDLIEYALVVGLIAFGATAAMGSLAGTINTAFTNIGTTLSTYTS